MNSPHISTLVRRSTFSVGALALLGMLWLPAANAQPGATSTTQPSPATQAEPAYSSSQPSDALKAEISSLSAPSFGSFSSDPQYGRQTGPRRTYGKPTYSDKWTNSDGSNKYGFAAGGGFTVPSGSTGKYYTTSWKFQLAGVRNFNKRYGVQVEYDYDHFGVTSGVLANLAAKYTAVDPTISTAGLDGNAHTWSFSVNPIINYYSSDRAGAYVIGGIGFYRKITNFTLPTSSYYCDYFYGCYPITQNQTFDHYSNNAMGLNAGAGFTWKLSQFSNAKLYTEARYVWVDNSAAPHSFFPPNNYRTGYFPIVVGIRW